MNRPPSDHDLTQQLRALNSLQGNPGADHPLVNVMYDELAKIAAGYMHRERDGHTLQPTALVHEAYLRLIDQDQCDWRDRRHFYGIAARIMRQVLVDHARNKGAAKRGGAWRRVTFDEALDTPEQTEQDILELDGALKKLADLDGRMAQVVELRVFGGLTMEDVAATLDVSLRTAHNDWRVAKMWLASALEGEA